MITAILVISSMVAVVFLIFTIFVFVDKTIKSNKQIRIICMSIFLFFSIIVAGIMVLNYNEIKSNTKNKKYDIIVGTVDSISRSTIIIDGDELDLKDSILPINSYYKFKVNDIVKCYYIQGYLIERYITKIDKLEDK